VGVGKKAEEKPRPEIKRTKDIRTKNMTQLMVSRHLARKTCSLPKKEVDWLLWVFMRRCFPSLFEFQILNDAARVRPWLSELDVPEWQELAGDRLGWGKEYVPM
jgi:hypothetical protein